MILYPCGLYEGMYERFYYKIISKNVLFFNEINLNKQTQIRTCGYYGRSNPRSYEEITKFITKYLSQTTRPKKPNSRGRDGHKHQQPKHFINDCLTQDYMRKT